MAAGIRDCTLRSSSFGKEKLYTVAYASRALLGKHRNTWNDPADTDVDAVAASWALLDKHRDTWHDLADTDVDAVADGSWALLDNLESCHVGFWFVILDCGLLMLEFAPYKIEIYVCLPRFLL